MGRKKLVSFLKLRVSKDKGNDKVLNRNVFPKQKQNYVLLVDFDEPVFMLTGGNKGGGEVYAERIINSNCEDIFS